MGKSQVQEHKHWEYLKGKDQAASYGVEIRRYPAAASKGEDEGHPGDSVS